MLLWNALQIWYDDLLIPINSAFIDPKGTDLHFAATPVLCCYVGLFLALLNFQQLYGSVVLFWSSC